LLNALCLRTWLRVVGRRFVLSHRANRAANRLVGVVEKSHESVRIRKGDDPEPFEPICAGRKFFRLRNDRNSETSTRFQKSVVRLYSRREVPGPLLIGEKEIALPDVLDA